MAATDVGLVAHSTALIAADTLRYAAEKTICSAGAAADSAATIAVNAALPVLTYGFLTAAGLAKQYDALEKQGNLYEAQRDVALKNIALAEKTFSDTFLPAYKMSTDYFEKNFRKQWEPILTKVSTCGIKECEYTADYERHTPRVLADVARVIAGAKRSARRALDVYSVGACFEQDFRFAEMQVRMVTDAKTLGRNYEEEFKYKKDVFYWNRLTTSAQIAQNIGSLASNLLSSGKGSLVNGLQAINAASSSLDKAIGSGLSTLSNESKFFGSLGAAVSGLFNQRDAVADTRALTGQAISEGNRGQTTFAATVFTSGPDYTPMSVNYSLASQTVSNNSGASIQNTAFDTFLEP